nr:hypothetical protein [Deltaproteobacteria bacterium]
DLLGCPHHVIADLDTCAYGAALIAIVATEQLADRPDLATLAARVRQPGRLVTPDPSAYAAYDAAYRRYQRLTATLAPLQTTRWNADDC